MIKVYLVERHTGPNRNIECQWIDPVTGKLKTKSTGTKQRRKAERFAGELQADLNAGRINDTANTLWETVVERYETEVLASLAAKTAAKFRGTRKAIREIIDPKFAVALSASQISIFQTKLRAKGLRESTIKGHLAALRACLNWAVRVGLIQKAPHITMPKRTGKMKGRPITTEEFDRMLSVLPKCNLGAYVDRWDFLLRGLWLSGLRLDEALRLDWRLGSIVVNTTSGRPRLKIEANADKSSKPRMLPITPDFAEFLLAVPEAQRTGRVFKPISPGQLSEMRLDTCSKIISKIGQKAGVLVAEYPPTLPDGEPRKKWASAHDLRRAFGTRWAKVLRPNQLQELMRHESIQTTMTFYVEETVSDIETATDAGRKQLPNSSPNSEPKIESNSVEN